MRFGASDAGARITQIYEQLYNRAPDAAGLAFWTDAIANGGMTMADAAIQILHGAQGADAGLAALRQSAVEAFTAQVAKTGVAYDGYAAIEAARVLVKAVGANASAADIDAMIKATAKLVDIAHDNPKVVDAIAVGTTLEKLFDTARGRSEPVNLVKTLADVAEAAAGNPATLESLLRGGGMDKVLQVMPANATLGNVVDALASGGLPAAIEVVYPSAPSAPSTPAKPLALAFHGVSEGANDLHLHDNVTNVASAEVEFSFSRALTSKQSAEWSTDGGATWHTDGIEVMAKDRIVVIHELDLTGHGLHQPRTPLPVDVTTTVQVRVVEGGKVVATASQDIVYDGYVATPSVEFDTSKTHQEMVPDGAIVTGNPAFTVGRIEDGARVEYLVAGNGANAGSWTGTKPTLHEGDNTFTVRQTDVAGNVDEREVTVKLDTMGPSTIAGLALEKDTGTSDGDKLTNAAKVKITGLDTHTDTAWEYSLDQGAHWIDGDVNDGSGSALLDLSRQEDGALKVWVRQYDAAGNLGTTVTLLDFTLDTKAPQVTFTFDGVEGNADATKPGTTTLASADVTFKFSGALDTGDVVQWRTGSGDWKAVDAADIGQDTVTIHDLDLSNTDPTVQVRVGDAAGNFTDAVGQKIDGPYDLKPLDVKAVASGMELKVNVEGTIVLNDGRNVTTLALSQDVNPIAGAIGVGAQQTYVEGFVAIKNTQIFDSAVAFYGLGTAGNDNVRGITAWGFGGDDVLKGDARSADHLYGGDGNDTLEGMGGADLLNGGAGNDVFVFSNGNSVNGATPGAKSATIADFEGNGVDQIVFKSTTWTDAAMTASATLFTSFADLLQDAQAKLGVPGGAKVYAGQLGADTYVFAKTVSNDAAYVDGVDTMVKLAKFFIGDLSEAGIKGVASVSSTGTDSFVFDGSFAGDSRGSTPVYVLGTAQADRIVGGSGDDLLAGGKGGDLIVLSGGTDTLVYDSPADSHLAAAGANAQVQPYDTVVRAGGADVQAVKFAFGGDLLGVRKVDADVSQGDLMHNLDAAYRAAATSRYDALLVESTDASYLVVNNGDNVIDANDYVVKIVGNGSIAMDDDGHAVFTFASRQH